MPARSLSHKMFSVELSGEIRALEALTGVSKHAAFAQKSALRAAGRKGRKGVVRELAIRNGVPQKVFRKRVRFFTKRGGRQDIVARSRIWAGVASTITPSEHKNVLPEVRARNPKGFQPELKSGHKGWFFRKYPPRRAGRGARLRPKARNALPIKEYGKDYSAGTPELMKDNARKAMLTTYPEKFKEDYKRRINKLRAKWRR